MNSENIYFVDTPVEIQDEYFYNILEKLEEIEIDNNAYVYLKFSSIMNLPGKFFFKGFIKDAIEIDKTFNYEPDFLIFLS